MFFTNSGSMSAPNPGPRLLKITFLIPIINESENKLTNLIPLAFINT